LGLVILGACGTSYGGCKRCEGMWTIAKVFLTKLEKTQVWMKNYKDYLTTTTKMIKVNLEA
jgi:hypothetical protein